MFLFDEHRHWVSCRELAKRYRRETTPRTWDIKPPKRKRKKGNE